MKYIISLLFSFLVSSLAVCAEYNEVCFYFKMIDKNIDKKAPTLTMYTDDTNERYRYLTNNIDNDFPVFNSDYTNYFNKNKVLAYGAQGKTLAGQKRNIILFTLNPNPTEGIPEVKLVMVGTDYGVDEPKAKWVAQVALKNRSPSFIGDVGQYLISEAIFLVKNGVTQKQLVCKKQEI